MPETIVPVSYQLARRDPAAFVKRLAGSFERYGFAVVSDQELPLPLIDGCLNRTPFGVETAKGATHHELKEFWQIGRWLAINPPRGMLV